MSRQVGFDFEKKKREKMQLLICSTREYRRKPVGRKELESLMDDEEKDPDYQEE